MNLILKVCDLRFLALAMVALIVPFRTVLADQKSDAIANLNSVITNWDAIDFLIEEPDWGQIRYLRTLSKTLLSAIEQDHLFDPETSVLFQDFVFDYRFSENFFNQIAAIDEIKSQVAKLRESAASMKSFGLSESRQPYPGTMVAFRQIRLKVTSLLTHSLSATLKENLEKLQPEIDKVLGAAVVGDIAETFRVAAPVHFTLNKVLSAETLSRSDAAYEDFIELRGLTQIYLNYRLEKQELVMPKTTGPRDLRTQSVEDFDN